MKNILIVIPAYTHGGTNKSLQNIMSCLDVDEFSIDIMVMCHVGPCKIAFAKYNVLKASFVLSTILESYNHLQNDGFLLKVSKIFVKSVYRFLLTIMGKRVLNFIYCLTARVIEKKKYDSVIAMQEGRATHFVAYFNTPKIAWIRSDYNKYLEKTRQNEESIYAKFDHIICVSKYTSKVLLDHYPALQAKCHGIHNMIDSHSILEMSNDSSFIDRRFKTNGFTIISVGRLDKVKQFDIIPQIASELKLAGCEFTWYIIGDGEENENISAMIEKYKVTDIVLMLGAKDNPYPYIKHSDILVCTSASEACPNVINEARILHVPVVSTDFGSVTEFVENGFNGIISPKENLTDALLDLFQNEAKYAKIKSNISSFSYSNEQIINDITKLL